jgi:hypothetical protein
MVFRDLNADSSSVMESAALWLKSRGDAPRSLDAVGRSRGEGLDYGQRELVILSKRAKSRRGCQVALLRRDSSGVEDREEHALRFCLVAKFMAGVLNQCGTRHLE